MTVGQLRDRVTLLTPVLVDDGQGGQTVSGWTAGDEVAAAFTTLAGREAVGAGGMQASMGARVVIRYRTGVTAQMRIRRERDQKVFELGAPPRDVDDRQRWLELDALETRS